MLNLDILAVMSGWLLSTPKNILALKSELTFDLDILVIMPSWLLCYTGCIDLAPLVY